MVGFADNKAGPAASPDGAWDTKYEFRVIALLTLAFGLVGLDRWVLPPLFAAGMGADLGLTPADLGNLVGALGIAWGVSAMVLGGLSDRLGRRKILVPAVALFSVLSVVSGLATTLLGLVVIRAAMGIAEGPVASVGIATAVEASHPKRRGMNNGIFQCSFALFGLALAPILATQLLRFMSWHYVFAVVGIPGMIVAILLWRTVREPATIAQSTGAPRAAFKDLFKHRNVVLAMLGLLCAMTGIFVLSAMMPSYLTGFLKLGAQQMGLVTAAIGIGGFIGQFSLPAISDHTGRRTSTVIAFAVSALTLWAFIQTGPSLGLLFALLFVVSWANFGALAIIAGPIAAEAAPLGLISTVTGVVVGAGEIFGGGIAPSIAGAIANGYGLQYTLWFAMGGQLLGILVALFFKETAPRRTGGSTGEVSELDEYEGKHPEGIAGQ
ncbi:MAG: MFS transporter [Steroidobacteraceae bacterium]